MRLIQTQSWPSYAVLALILLISAGLRLYGLDDQSLWTDEFRSLGYAQSETLGQVVERNQRDVHPPLFDLILFIVVRTIGDSVIALRILSAVAGALATYFMLLLGRRLNLRWEGLVAASLLAISWFPLFLSQEARPYSLLILGTIVSFHQWLRIHQSLLEKNTVGWTIWMPYVLCAVLLMYLHYFGSLVIAIQAFYLVPVIWLAPKCRNLLILIYGIILMAYSPWLPTMFSHLFYARTWLTEPSFRSTVNLFEVLYPSLQVRVCAALFYALGVGGVCHWVYRNRNSLTIRIFYGNPTAILLFWLCAPLIVTYLISSFIVPVWQNRNLVIVLPAVYLLLARSISAGMSKRLLQQTAALLMISMMVHALIFDKEYYSRPQRPQLREAAQYIADRETHYPGAPVMACLWSVSSLNYYFQKLGANSRTVTMACEEWDMDAARKLLTESETKYLWLASAHRQPTQSLLNALNEMLEIVEKKNLHRASVTLYRVPRRNGSEVR